jgi:rhamnogalacturonyl hydrolase YesR
MMNRTIKVILAFALVAAWGMGCSAAKSGLTPDEVKVISVKVANWAIEHERDAWKYRIMPDFAPSFAEKKWPDLDWHNGALYAGMIEFCEIVEDPKYVNWLKEIAERNDWKLFDRLYHADDHAVGHLYTRLSELYDDPSMLKPTRESFDTILANRKTGKLNYARGSGWDDRWGWCDALFMAPPVWARLARITGERQYLDFMDEEYHVTYDLLWDKRENLFYRDTRYFTRFEENGKSLFWSRGNGWVFGGLSLMIPDLPEDWEGRAFYLKLFNEMAVKLKEIQRPDGTWSMGLLGGLEGHPGLETSGSCFFTQGLAWGVNTGLLDRETYEPVVLKAWNALASCVNEEGMLGYVQATGKDPGNAYADKTEVYAIGAFLAAGSEVYKLVWGETP